MPYHLLQRDQIDKSRHQQQSDNYGLDSNIRFCLPFIDQLYRLTINSYSSMSSYFGIFRATGKTHLSAQRQQATRLETLDYLICSRVHKRMWRSFGWGELKVHPKTVGWVNAVCIGTSFSDRLQISFPVELGKRLWGKSGRGKPIYPLAFCFSIMVGEDLHLQHVTELDALDLLQSIVYISVEAKARGYLSIIQAYNAGAESQTYSSCY